MVDLHTSESQIPRDVRRKWSTFKAFLLAKVGSDNRVHSYGIYSEENPTLLNLREGCFAVVLRTESHVSYEDARNRLVEATKMTWPWIWAKVKDT